MYFLPHLEALPPYVVLVDVSHNPKSKTPYFKPYSSIVKWARSKEMLEVIIRENEREMGNTMGGLFENVSGHSIRSYRMMKVKSELV